MKLFASLSTALVLLTCMSAQLSHAQIFSWVDEHGVKHFGDQVPEKYKDAKHAVSLNKLNTTQGVSLKPAKNSLKNTKNLTLALINAETQMVRSIVQSARRAYR